jgi:hypothetical protein
MGDVVILLGILMYKASLSPLFVRILGVQGVWYGMTVTVIDVHLTVVKGRTFRVPALYMNIVMARVIP